MQLPEFIFIEPQSSLRGAGFVLCTMQPFYIGKVYKFRTVEEMRDFISSKNDWETVKLPGYTIVICLFTCLAGIRNPVKGQLNNCLVQMANYYLNNKITPHAAAYSRYKES